MNHKWKNVEHKNTYQQNSNGQTGHNQQQIVSDERSINSSSDDSDDHFGKNNADTEPESESERSKESEDENTNADNINRNKNGSIQIQWIQIKWWCTNFANWKQHNLPDPTTS